MNNNGRLDWMLHRKLSYISVTTLIKKKNHLPPFFTGRKLHPLCIGIEAPGVVAPQPLP